MAAKQRAGKKKKITSNDATKMEMVQRVVKQGTKQTEVAREYGVTRQYVSFLVKRYREDGNEALVAKPKGRKKEGQLSKSDRAKLLEIVFNKQPADFAIAGDDWSVDAFRGLVDKTVGKAISRRAASRCLIDWGLLELKPPEEDFDDDFYEYINSDAYKAIKHREEEYLKRVEEQQATQKRRGPGRPRKEDALRTAELEGKGITEIPEEADDDDWDVPDWKEVQWEKMGASRPGTQATRTGRHGKQRFAPTMKKKARKKRSNAKRKRKR